MLTCLCLQTLPVRARWRKLEGSDPSTYEMIQKIQTLQKRLISKTEEAVEKDLLIQVCLQLVGWLAGWQAGRCMGGGFCSACGQCWSTRLRWEAVRSEHPLAVCPRHRLSVLNQAGRHMTWGY